MLADFDANGITITDGPTLTFVDPVAQHFTVRMITASRFLIDDYTNRLVINLDKKKLFHFGIAFLFKSIKVHP